MERVDRRSFLKGSLAAPVSSGLASAPAEPKAGIVDTHVFLSRWPGRRLIGDETRVLVNSLRERGVVQAWTGSFDALLHKDIAGINARLAAECEKNGTGLLLPFGAVNPMLPDWEDDLRRCRQEFRMQGIRLHPNYHNYTLRDPALTRLFQVAAEHGLLIQIAAWMEDERTQYPLLQVPIVDLSPLPGLLERTADARVVVLNGFISTRGVGQVLAQLNTSSRVAFDIAMLEQMLGVRVLIEAVGAERIVFGSYSPMFYFESASLKLRESVLTAGEIEAIGSGNARRLLGRS